MAVSDAAAGEASRDSSGACCMRIKFVQLSSQLYNTVVVQLSTRGVRVLYCNRVTMRNDACRFV